MKTLESATLRDTLEGRGVWEDLADCCLMYWSTATMMHIAKIDFHVTENEEVYFLIKLKAQPTIFGGLHYPNSDCGPYSLDANAFDVFESARERIESNLLPEVTVTRKDTE